MSHFPPRLLTALLKAVLVAALSASLGAPQAVAGLQDIHGDAAAPGTTPLARDLAFTVRTSGRDRERGTRFRPDASSQVTALKYYRVRGDRGRHRARLWSASGRQLRTVVFPRSRRVGWQQVALDRPATVRAAKTYVTSFSSRRGVPFAVQRRAGAGGAGYSVGKGATAAVGRFPHHALRRLRHLVRPVLAQSAGAPPASSPAAPAPTSSFPDAASTGVPDGTPLTPYGGGSTIRTEGAVLDARQVSGTLWIEARGVEIRRSLVQGNIVVSPSGSVTLSDTTVDGGTFNGSAVGQYNITMRRVEVVGARQSVSCNENCDIQDSWLHAQYMQPGSDWHGDGFISNGGSNMLVRHNTLGCDSQPTDNGGACTAAVALFADFDPLSAITIDANLFTASPAGYCLYGGYDPAKPFGANPTGIVITNNVFQRGANRKCATFGPVTAIADGGPGNVYADNVWEDGQRVPAP